MEAARQVTGGVVVGNLPSFINFIMQRTRAVAPEGKVVYYRSDGTGRDSYIR